VSSYLLHHLLFTAPVLFALAYFKLRLPEPTERRFLTGMGLLVCIAVLYTTPWDSYLLSRGVWSYGDGVVLLRLWGVPLGEYLFFIIQTLITSVWLYVLPFSDVEDGQASVFGDMRLTLPWLVLGMLGGWLLFSGDPSYFYLGAILAWAAPVMVVQWGFGGQRLLEERTRLFTAVAVPTLYLWIVDWVAIERGLWTISRDTRTGVDLLGLPVEEAVFFLATNLMVVQGLILYEWLMSEDSSVSASSTLIEDA
jgi:lycopene cyclase domain-containing protein